MCPILILFAVLIFGVTRGIPIPKRKVGFVYKGGSPYAPVHLDFFVDLHCPDSTEAFPAIFKLADDYGPKTLRLTTHLFPLPYHRNAFLASKATHVVNMMSLGNLTYDWIKDMLVFYKNFSTSGTHEMSGRQVMDLMTQRAGRLGLDQAVFRSMVENNRDVDHNTRVAWKYACSRGVYGTPTFMVNDVIVDGNQSWSKDEWKKMIDPLIPVQPTLLENENPDAPCQVHHQFKFVLQQVSAGPSLQITFVLILSATIFSLYT